jgi:Fic-DOC domain mobile mystery protein B
MPVFENIFGATPIDDLSELIPTHITTREELNEWEAANILKATRKYLSKRINFQLTVAFIKEVHREMFDETWKWAGRLRTKNYNIGVPWAAITEQLGLLIKDYDSWLKSLDKLALSVRLHHRLVKIHPFVNGNGRHARLLADIFLFSFEQSVPQWPGQELIEATGIREKYIRALQAADQGNYRDLEEFTKRLI